jgi:hypothetical protein
MNSKISASLLEVSPPMTMGSGIAAEGGAGLQKGINP